MGTLVGHFVHVDFNNEKSLLFIAFPRVRVVRNIELALQKNVQ